MAKKPKKPEKKPPSTAQTTENRLLRFVVEVLGVEFGSLWWVPDSDWLAVIPGFTPREGNRHPGVCINFRPPASIHDKVPTLLGVSRNIGPVKVTGLSKKDSCKATFFGAVLRPGNFKAIAFVPGKGSDSRNTIRRIKTKPSLDDAESADLRRFLNHALGLDQ